MNKEFYWIFEEDGTLVALQCVKGDVVSNAYVIKNKLDTMFRDDTGLGIGLVPEEKQKEYKKWLKSWTQQVHQS